MKYLNWIRSSVENRYLAERVVVAANNPGPALRVLANRLQQNEVVSITVRGSATRPISAPFMESKLAVAPGAPFLAWKTNARLIPVFTVRTEIGRYRINLGAPIEIRRDCPREEAFKWAAEEYAKRLERFVLDYPGQWIDWINI